MRTYGFTETFYEQAREKGVIFTRYEVDEKPIVKKDKTDLKITIHDQILNEELCIHADKIVLAPAIIPSQGNDELARLLKVPLNNNGFFLEAHVKLRPVDFAKDGIFLAGMAHYPKTIDEAITQSNAAVSRALTVLSKDQVEIEPCISTIDESKCIGCGLCNTLCPSKAINLVVKEGGRKAEVIAASCKGCGICGASCPQQAISMQHFRNKEITAQIDAYGG
jgi:heterodisulfide reductase subunit A